MALIFIIPSSLSATDRDSAIVVLKEELSSASGQDKSGIYLNISKHFKYSNYDSALRYAILSDEFADKYNLTEERVNALLLMANNYNNTGNSFKTAESYQLAKRIGLKSGNPESLAQIYLSLSIYYSSKFQYTQVLISLDSALYYITEYNISSMKSKVYYKIANLYYTLNEIHLAKRYVQLAYYDLHKDNYELEIRINHLDGMINFKENHNKLTLESFEEALEIAKQHKNKQLQQLSYRRLSGYYIDMRDFKTAEEYIDSSVQICDEMGLYIEKSALVTYLAHIAWLQFDFETALLYNKRALEIREKTGHRTAISSSLLNIGGNYIKLGNYQDAEKYLLEGLKVAIDQNTLVYIARGYKLLSEVYEITGRYDGSLKYFKNSTLYEDSIFHIRSTEKTLFFSNLYEIEREKRQIDSEKLEKVSTNIIYLVIVLILLAGIIVLLFWNNYVRRKHHKEILKLSKVIETTDQGVLISDARGKIDYFNNGAIKLLDYQSKSEFEGKNIIDIVDYKGTVLLNQTVLPQIQKKGSWSGEIGFTTKDGEKRVAFLTCSAIVDGTKPDLFVAIFSDISERKRYEKALQRSQKELQETVETQEKMFSIIAHDLTGPFNTILGFTSELANNFDTYNKKDLIKFSRIINESSKNTYNLLSNLLHWSRTKLGRIEIVKIEVDLFPIVDQNVKLLSPSAQNKEITIKNEIGIDAKIFADGSTIDIVIRNLITNAIKFTPRNGTITISLFLNDKVTQINIEDTGIGIKPEVLDNIFKESNAKSTLGTENEKGTGLGLIVCNELVLLNNGTISVESELNKGSKFTISLPNQ